MSFHEGYYHSQFGSGRGVDTVFVGSPRMRGHGLGSWFSGIFRSALPLLAKGARAVGKEALRAGVNILDDVTENNRGFKESFHSRLNESGLNLKRKASEKINKMMEGSGYMHSIAKRHLQSPLVSGVQQTALKTRRRRRRRRTRKTGKSVKRLNARKKKVKSKKNSKKKSKKPKRKSAGKRRVKKSKKRTRKTDIFS